MPKGSQGSKGNGDLRQPLQMKPQTKTKKPKPEVANEARPEDELTADPAWVPLEPLVTNALDPIAVNGLLRTPRQYMDALMSTDFCGPDVEPKTKKAVGIALSTEIVPWLMDYEVFRAHIAEHEARVSTYHQQRVLPLHPLIREAQERIGALEATVNRQASAIAALTARTEWLEMVLQRTLEGHAPSSVCRSPSIEERVMNAQRVARLSRSPGPRGAPVGRMLPQDALLDKTAARGSDDQA